MYDYKRQFHISTTDLNAPVKKKSAFEYYIFCASEHKRVKERKCTSCLNWPVCYSLCASGKNMQFTHLSELLPNATSSVLQNIKE